MSTSPIVTLTTDWSATDFFVGRVKGLLYSSIPDVRVVDVSHGIMQYDMGSALMIVREGCMGFPAGTIHIVDVKSAYHANVPNIVVKYKGQYFIMADNGLPYLLFGNDFEQGVQLTGFKLPEFGNFLAYDVYCKAAIMIAAGAAISEFGEDYPALRPSSFYNYVEDRDQVRCYVTYIDSYGNAYLGLTYERFEAMRAGRDFVLTVRDHKTDTLTSSYAMGNNANFILTVSSTGYLQLAIRCSNAARLMGIKVMQMVVIDFK